MRPDSQTWEIGAFFCAYDDCAEVSLRGDADVRVHRPATPRAAGLCLGAFIVYAAEGACTNSDPSENKSI